MKIFFISFCVLLAACGKNREENGVNHPASDTVSLVDVKPYNCQFVRTIAAPSIKPLKEKAVDHGANTIWVFSQISNADLMGDAYICKEGEF